MEKGFLVVVVWWGVVIMGFVVSVGWRQSRDRWGRDAGLVCRSLGWRGSVRMCLAPSSAGRVEVLDVEDLSGWFDLAAVDEEEEERVEEPEVEEVESRNGGEWREVRRTGRRG